MYLFIHPRHNDGSEGVSVFSVKGQFQFPQSCLLSSCLPVFLRKLSRAASHSQLAIPFLGSTNMASSVPRDEMWTAVAMVTGVPLKAKAPVDLAPRLAQVPMPDSTLFAATRW